MQPKNNSVNKVKYGVLANKSISTDFFIVDKNGVIKKRPYKKKKYVVKHD